MKEPEPLQQIDRTFVRFRGRKLVYFSGCDYHRMASHPKVIAAVQKGIARFGLNVAASRMTTGNHRIYGELEQRLAGFFGYPAATLVSSGYSAPLTAAQALKGQFTHALIDERSHACLFDASSFLGCPLTKFAHRNPESLRECLRAIRTKGGFLLLTDGHFSHDGSAAPLDQYLHLLPKGSALLVDDAHGAGVLGRTGRGAIELTGVSRGNIILTVTLSKAFGTYGGAILSTADFRDKILGSSTMFVGNTPLPLPLACGAHEAVKLLTPRLIERLNANSELVKRELIEAGLPIKKTPGPIVALPPQSTDVNETVYAALLRAGIYPPLIRYLNTPKQGYFRFVISSQHSTAQLRNLIHVLIAHKAAFA